MAAAGLQSNSPPVVAFIDKIFGTDNSQPALDTLQGSSDHSESKPTDVPQKYAVDDSMAINIPSDNLRVPESSGTSVNEENKSEPNTTNKNDNGLTKEEALSLINKWLESRSQILGPPYKRLLLEEVAHSSGCLYEDLMSEKEGSISYLEDGSHKYEYGPYQLKTWAVALTNNPPYLTAEIKGSYTYYDSQGGSRVGSPSQRLAFVFKKENVNWKIDNYVEIDTFNNYLKENQDFDIRNSNFPCLKNF